MLPQRHCYQYPSQLALVCVIMLSTVNITLDDEFSRWGGGCREGRGHLGNLLVQWRFNFWLTFSGTGIIEK